MGLDSSCETQRYTPRNLEVHGSEAVFSLEKSHDGRNPKQGGVHYVHSHETDDWVNRCF